MLGRSPTWQLQLWQGGEMDQQCPGQTCWAASVWSRQDGPGKEETPQQQINQEALEPMSLGSRA